MFARSTEGLMDFEYDNKTGPVDTASPFMKLSQQQQQQQPQHDHTKTDNLQKKRQHSVLESPSKSQQPRLREPASSATFYFSQTSPSKPLPPTPLSNNPAFNTPRKFEPNYDSSEIDASSPEYNADSDATPDNTMGMRSGIGKMTTMVRQALTPEKKNPAIARIAGVSGKGDIVKSSAYSRKAEDRIKKKRSRTGNNWLAQVKRRSNSESSDEAQTRGSRPSQDAQGPGLIASVFAFIHTHPDLPHILSFYAQLLLNVFLVFFFIYIIFCFWSTIRADVDKKSEEAIAAVMVEMAGCAQSFQDNKCDRSTRAPALEALCNNWEKCMNKDPRSVGRARVSAHTFAEIFNGFIEPISWKAMIFTFVLVFGCVGISNFAFGFFRNKAHPPVPSQTPQYMPTPQQHPSGPQDYVWHPHQSPAAGYGGYGGGYVENGSPTRRQLAY